MYHLDLAARDAGKHRWRWQILCIIYWTCYNDKIAPRRLSEVSVYFESHSEGIGPQRREAWWQENKVAGHAVSSVRKQRETTAGAQLASPFPPPFPQSGTQTYGSMLPIYKADFLFSVF